MKPVLWSIAALVIGAVLVLWVLRFVAGVLGALMPVLILGGVIYVVYKATTKTSIGPGKRRILP